MKKILVYTGPVQSGKTSRLLSFIRNRNDIGGILSLLIDGKKYLYDISSGERKLLEADTFDEEGNVYEVGKYKFKAEVFKWGRDILKKASAQKYNLILIDEIGPLELEGRGLSPVADEIISNYRTCIPKIFIVVRESLFNKFLKHYNLTLQDIEFFKTD